MEEAALESSRLFKHILVPVDGSETSIHAGRFALRLAAAHHARLTFMYVIDTTIVEEIAGATSRAVQTIHQELEEKGRHYLDYLTRLAQAQELQAQQLVRRGIPHHEITDAARELADVDLIVIGRVGCRGPRCVLIGSVAERVIERARCPVLVIGHAPVGHGA